MEKNSVLTWKQLSHHVVFIFVDTNGSIVLNQAHNITIRTEHKIIFFHNCLHQSSCLNVCGCNQTSLGSIFVFGLYRSIKKDLKFGLCRRSVYSRFGLDMFKNGSYTHDQQACKVSMKSIDC